VNQEINSNASNSGRQGSLIVSRGVQEMHISAPNSRPPDREGFQNLYKRLQKQGSVQEPSRVEKCARYLTQIEKPKSKTGGRRDGGLFLISLPNLPRSKKSPQKKKETSPRRKELLERNKMEEKKNDYLVRRGTGTRSIGCIKRDFRGGVPEN